MNGGFILKKATLAQDIVENIRDISRLIHLRHHELAEKSNLTLDQFHIMIYLDKKDTNKRVKDIAKKFKIAQNTMSEKISRMEEKNLISRKQDEKDKRAINIELTEEGKKMLTSIRYKARNEFIKESIEDVSEDEIRCFLNTLKHIKNKLE